jgi:hypothetical protein
LQAGKPAVKLQTILSNRRFLRPELLSAFPADPAHIAFSEQSPPEFSMMNKTFGQAFSTRWKLTAPVPFLFAMPPLITNPDGKNWTKVGRFDNTWQNNIPQSPNSKTWKFPPQTVDLTSTVNGLKDFYLKISLTTGDADDRFCLGGFRILTADTASSTN